MTDAFPVTWDDPSDAQLSWEWDDMHFPHALTPLSGDYAMRAISPGFNYRYKQHGLPIEARCRIINGYAYFATRFEVPDSDRPRVREQAQESRRAQARIVRTYWEQKVLPTLRTTYQWLQEAPIETAPLATVAHAWDELWTRAPYLHGLHFMTNAGSYQSVNDLADLYESMTPGARPGDAFALVQGISTELQRVERDLYLLAERARSIPHVKQAVLHDSTAALANLPHLDGGREFLNALEEFLAAHGHLGQAFEDLMEPSWEDHPALVLVEVRKRLQHPQEDPEARRRRLAAASDALAEQVRARLHDRPDELRQFEATLALAREAGPLTESHNYWLDRMLHAHARRFALRVGKRLVHADVLTEPEDIFYLHVGEVGKALGHPTDLRQVVNDRKRAHTRWNAVRPPKYLGQAPDPTAPLNRFDAEVQPQSDPRMLRGIGACAGTVRGSARVVLSPDDFARVQPGDILVCPSSNPSWVPLFGIISGLITNTGGVTSHAAVVAREFGLPAVVGTGDATHRVRDGQTVEVDGTSGEVRLL